MILTRTPGVFVVALGLLAVVFAQEPPKPTWSYSPELLRPFWEGAIVEGESVLFIKDEKTGEARASVLFPIREVLAIKNSVGDVTYENGKDFVWKPDSREIVIPAGSRIPTKTPQDMRRPAKTQKYELTHRDGNDEIFFGGRLEYADMQTCITYRHAPNLWKGDVPKFDPQMLPRSVAKLVSRQPLSIVTLGDSISAGANASALFDAAPYQPAYPELVRRQLAERFRNPVEMKNLAVGGTDTGWGLTQIDKVVEAKPNLVILAFGMNDSAGRSPQSYQETMKKMIAAIREKLPECEFILVASMLGNRDWVRLKHEVFPQYRDVLKEIVEPGIALADLTSIWTGFLELKKDWDQSGNGVNHPNDFGHRVYAQVITTLLDPRGEPSAVVEPPKTIEAGPLKLIEQRLLGNYTYSYACTAFDLDGDGDLDLTSSDAEPNSHLYLLLNDGTGGFQHSFIQKYAGLSDQPIRLERHAIGDINRDGRPDIVIVDNLKSDIRWFENPGPESMARPWLLHRIAQPAEVPGSYDVALADLDADGDLDLAASSWNGQRFDWFENVGSPDNGEKWVRHQIAEKIGETRTIKIGLWHRRDAECAEGRLRRFLCALRLAAVSDRHLGKRTRSMTPQEAKTFLAENKIKFVLAQFVDIHGVPKAKAVPASHFEDILTDGAGFAGFAVWGLGQEPHDPDYMAVGDLATLSLVPWQPGFARIVCDGRVKGKAWPFDTRYILKQQIARLQERGWTLNTGMEPEFMLIRRTEDGGFGTADSTDLLDKPCYDYKGLSRSRVFIERLVECMQAVGIDVYQVDHEDANGQFEVNFTYSDALTTADRIVFFRMGACEIARECGAICTFMPKPMHNRTGSGLHMHISMSDAKTKNLFHNPADKRQLGLSKLAYQFLGGLLAHAPALAAICAPCVNSYKRLVVGRSFSGATWAPAYISYGDNNRTSMVRIPFGRIELRLTDSSANPYLATAAVIAAGLDGMERQLDPGDPHNVNLYTLTVEELREKGIKVLPQSLNDALNALQTDPLFHDHLGRDFVDEFIKLKRIEWVDYHRHVSDWEVNRYLEFY